MAAAADHDRQQAQPRQTAAAAARVEEDGRSGPAALARCALFEPIADLLARCGHALPGCAMLDRWRSDATTRGPRFVVPDAMRIGYEERIDARGEITTRPDNWHDFFNALVWLRFPQAKRALNDAHLRFMRSGGTRSQRGPVRDALTQFDESGIVVASADARLLDLLAARRWKELFWTRRADVAASMRFLVFGHGLYDALRAPFYRMCGRAAVFVVDRTLIAQDAPSLCGAIDPLLAVRFAEDYYPRPRALLALPILGIPGVTPDNASPDYYDDELQFRPPPAWM